MSLLKHAIGIFGLNETAIQLVNILRQQGEKGIAFKHNLPSVTQRMVQCEIFFLCTGPQRVQNQKDLRHFVKNWCKIKAQSEGTEAALVLTGVFPTDIVERVRIWGSNYLESGKLNLYYWPQVPSIEEKKRTTIVGGPEHCEWNKRLVNIFKKLHIPVMMTTLSHVESIRLATEALMVIKQSFQHSIAKLADTMHCDPEVIMHGLGLDPRIGQTFMQSDSAIPNAEMIHDLVTLYKLMSVNGKQDPLFRTILQLQKETKGRPVESAKSWLGQQKPSNMRIGVWGAFGGVHTFKTWVEEGYHVQCHNPSFHAKKIQKLTQKQPWAQKLIWCQTKEEAATGVDLLAIFSDDLEYHTANLYSIGKRMRRKRILDAVHLFPLSELGQLGFDVKRMGYEKLSSTYGTP